MALINMSVKHGRTLEDARLQLDRAVSDAHLRFGTMIQRTEWSPDRTGVKLIGTGFEAEMRVDSQDVHITADMPLLATFLGAPLVSGLKAIVQQTFHKQLT